MFVLSSPRHVNARPTARCTSSAPIEGGSLGRSRVAGRAEVPGPEPIGNPPQASELRLTPTGHLRWVEAGEPGSGDAPDAMRAAFDKDWRGGLFALAAERSAPGASLTIGYWQGVAEALLTRLCHLPADATPDQLEAPSESDLSRWVLAAPPMQGGEYLSAPVLRAIWGDVAAWCAAEARSAGGLHAWLRARAPRWHQVGRVCFHLAENKADPQRPFAFMATYVAGLGAAGQAPSPAAAPGAGAGRRGEQPSGADQAAFARPGGVRAAGLGQGDGGTRARFTGLWRGRPSAPTASWSAAPALEESGLTIRLPDWWRRRPRPRVPR